jgi:predicted Zn-dependent protease
MTAGELGRLDGWRLEARGALSASRGDDAIAAARRVLETAPDDRVALGCLGEALLRGGKLDEAAAASDKGLARDPRDGRLAFVRGSVLLAKRDPQSAVPWLETAARASLESDRWERLAQAYLALGDATSLEKAAAAARKALSFDPHAAYSVTPSARPIAGDPSLERTFGEIRRKQGKLGEAALHFERALLLSRSSRVAEALPRPLLRDAITLGALHEELGLAQEATFYYRMASEEPALKEEAEKALARLRK